MAPNALASVRVSRHLIPAHRLVPNTSIQNKPLLQYHAAFPPSSATASSIEAHLSSVGVVEPQWCFTMYSTSHFHSTSHEVLGIAAGKARLCFGHEDNPENVEVTAVQGDVLVVPAGVAHRLLEDETPGGGFQMVGSYPKGCSWDMCYGKKGEEEKVRGIVKVPWFERDPVYGDHGPVLEV
ncbi:RmlC-like cupin domain-containing protein [Xylariaceae sp. FL0016]|nr:RmlC-like cupin domain-containing protein [Xylariaceae sp. FL0016]